jgi:1-deoxy-D-xylulose-5-phosphate reductoisomerase
VKMADRRIAIIGSTGSIGTQALKVVDLQPERFEVTALTAHCNSVLLFEQVRKYRPAFAGLSGGEVQIPRDLRFCEWSFGNNALEMASGSIPCDDVLAAVVGMVGLRCVLAARRSGKRVLLANKEALVTGGQLVMDLCPPDEANPGLIPVDSEHSAVYQCLLAARGNTYRSIILTASGGPFRTWTANAIRNATLEDALRHPTWNMGRKITVDSATMFNKALEIIEAKWLFHAAPEQIEVLVHPESIVHSMVSFPDGAILAQLGVPDMRAPVSFAMNYPKRLDNGTPALHLDLLGTLHFEQPDNERFPAIPLAYQALWAGGTACCVLNAANEAAASAFLQGRARFRQIAPIVEETLNRMGTGAADTFEKVLEVDRAAREAAENLIQLHYAEDV